MGGILLLLVLCAVMALASFLAGALPLSMTLSQSQLRLLSSIGVGILVGTSLIVIIPEGIEAATSPGGGGHMHKVRSLVRRSPWTHDFVPRGFETIPTIKITSRQEAQVESIPPNVIEGAIGKRQEQQPAQPIPPGVIEGAIGRRQEQQPAQPIPPGVVEDAIGRRQEAQPEAIPPSVVDGGIGKRRSNPYGDVDGSALKEDLRALTSEDFLHARDEKTSNSSPSKTTPKDEEEAGGHGHSHGSVDDDKHSHSHEDTHAHGEVPTFEIGFSLILGFVLMFLIDRLPRHATDTLQSGPQTRHISLDNLGGESNSVDEEANGFLSSLTPTPKQSRSLATTTGLVIHAAADGIAMGASATTEDMKLGLIIFIAIMIHKAPAAFGLTSVLLKQGLSKRAARGHLVVFSLAAPVGAITTWFLITVLGGGNLEGDAGQWWTGMLLLFSGGTFLYVAMHAMQEDGSHGHEHGANGYTEGNSTNQRKPKGPQMRDTLATMVGMLVPLLTQFGHHH